MEPILGGVTYSNSSGPGCRLKLRVLCVEQKLSGSHKALVEMQDDVVELMRSAVREYPTSKVNTDDCLGGILCECCFFPVGGSHRVGDDGCCSIGVRKPSRWLSCAL